MLRRALGMLSLAAALSGCSLEGFADGAGGQTASSSGTGAGGGASGSGGSAGGASCACDCDPWAEVEVSSGGPAMSPVVAWTGEGWAVAWQDARDGNPEIYFARLAEDGSPIGAPLRVTSDDADSVAPALVWTGVAHAIVWEDTREGNSDVYMAFIDAGGAKTFGDAQVWGGTGAPSAPTMAWSPRTMSFVLTWEDFRDSAYKLFTGNVAADGTVIHTEERITDPPTGDGRGAAMAASPAEYGIVWQDTRDGDQEIYFCRVDSGGYKIGVDTRVTEAPGAAGEPSIAWTGERYALAWVDGRDGDAAIWASVLSEGGARRAPEQRVSMGGGSAGAPSIVWTGSALGLAWRAEGDGSRAIRFRRLDAEGAPLGPEARVAGENASQPSLAWSGSAYGMAWQEDARGGGTTIRFATCSP